jgi:hypothetical protein
MESSRSSRFFQQPAKLLQLSRSPIFALTSTTATAAKASVSIAGAFNGVVPHVR